MKNEERKSRGRRSGDASFPVAPSRREVPESYAVVLGEIKERIRSERLRVVMAANASMVLLYWDIGQMILERQEEKGWGARVIDRLSANLRDAFPDMQGLSPRNLKYMRAFAAAWSDREIVQEVLAQITWYHNIALLEKVRDPHVRLWYARKGLEEGWSHRTAAMPQREQNRGRIRPARIPKAYGRRKLGDPARENPARGAARQPAKRC